MTTIVECLRNYNFDWWSGGNPTDWTLASTTATTISRLQRNFAKDHPARQVIPTDRTRKFIYSGESDLRATLTAAAAADNFEIRQAASGSTGIQVNPGQRYAAKVAARCSVADNLLTIGVVGVTTTAGGTSTDTILLRVENGGAWNPQHGAVPYEWNTSTSLANAIDVTMQTDYRDFGLQFEVPEDVTSISIRVSNGSAGAQVIDLGMVSIRSLDYELVGA